MDIHGDQAKVTACYSVKVWEAALRIAKKEEPHLVPQVEAELAAAKAELDATPGRLLDLSGTSSFLMAGSMRLSELKRAQTSAPDAAQ